ncbi:MAG: hypothetical protein AAGA21_10780 [Pseudomonadota bacterium]
MTYEPYDPKQRQITPKTQVVAWICCALLIGSIAASDALTALDETPQQVATADAIFQNCG